MDYHSEIKIKVCTYIWHNVDVYWNHYAKGKKQVTKDFILYDSLYIKFFKQENNKDRRDPASCRSTVSTILGFCPEPLVNIFDVGSMGHFLESEHSGFLHSRMGMLSNNLLLSFNDVYLVSLIPRMSRTVFKSSFTLWWEILAW